ncbi:MAG: DUF5063 domain-containing protein [Tannerella sp.]|jgi:hypothetical protein|nr:DUF5063 domain-containing protein [Tannerella sp.]
MKEIYDKNTIEFVQVALEYCAMMESVSKTSLPTFVDKAVKIMPLLYLKGVLLPTVEEPEDDREPEKFITETTYNAIRYGLEELFGNDDTYLETFHPDIRYSDTPIAVSISESLTDIYQDIGNFIALFRTGNENVMTQALYICREDFRLYWGQKLLNALKAIHNVYINNY